MIPIRYRVAPAGTDTRSGLLAFDVRDGLRYMVKRDYQKAIKLAKTLYKYEDCNDLVYQLVGNCYDYLKNPKKALKVYAQGLKRFPDSGALYLEQGVVSGMQGHYDEAVASFEKGISVAPMFPSNYYRAAQFMLIPPARSGARFMAR